MEVRFKRYDNNNDPNVEMFCINCRLLEFSNCDYDTSRFYVRSLKFMKEHKDSVTCKETALKPFESKGSQH